MEVRCVLLSVLVLLVPAPSFQQEICEDVQVFLELSENSNVAARDGSTANNWVASIQNYDSEFNSLATDANVNLAVYSNRVVPSTDYYTQVPFTSTSPLNDIFGVRPEYFSGGAELIDILRAVSRRLVNPQRLVILYASTIFRLPAQINEMADIVASLQGRDIFPTIIAIGPAIADPTYISLQTALRNNPLVQGTVLFSWGNQVSVSGLADFIKGSAELCRQVTVTPTIQSRCEECLRERSGSVISDLTRCDRFYKCRRVELGGVTTYEGILDTCPSGTLYNDRIQACDHAANVLADPESGCNWCRETRTKYPIGNSCESYYDCQNFGTAAEPEWYLDVKCCPANTIFNENNPNIFSTGSDVPCDALVAQTCTRNALFEHPYYYRQYFTCVNGVREQTCCDGTDEFDAALGRCVAGTYCGINSGGVPCTATGRTPAGNVPVDSPCQYDALHTDGSYILRNCPTTSYFDANTCKCENSNVTLVEACSSVAVVTGCEAKLLVDFQGTQNNTWGFDGNPASDRYSYVGLNGAPTISSDNNLNYIDLEQQAPTGQYGSFSEISQYPFTRAGYLFRARVKDDVSTDASGRTVRNNREMIIFSNENCNGNGLPSIYIGINPATQTVTYTLRITDDANYVPGVPAAATQTYTRTIDYSSTGSTYDEGWKEVSLLYVPGRMEFHLRMSGVNAPEWNSSEAPVQTVLGVIDSRRCSLSFGGVDNNLDGGALSRFNFEGLMTDIRMHECDTVALTPAVDERNLLP